MWNRSTQFAALAGVAALAAGACALAQDPKNLSGSIQIDGSSTVQPISAAVAEEFRTVAPNVKVTVGTSGTGGGFKRFVTGDLDISDASRPIKTDEAAKAKSSGVEFIELPIAFDGLSIVVNKSNYWVETLTLDDLRLIFRAVNPAKTWKELRAEWPDRPISLHAPGTDSGTFEYFKETVVGKDGQIRGDMSVSEDDNVLVRGVSGDENGLAFFGFAYYWENKDQLKLIKIDAGKGPIAPSHQTIEDGTYAPFSRPLFIYVSKKAAARPEVKAFVEFYLDHAAELAEEVGYVKLPSAIYETVKKNYKSMKTGTQFTDENGKTRAGRLADIYK